MSRIGVALVSFCLICLFCDALGQIVFPGYDTEEIAQSPVYWQRHRTADRQPLISCKENAVNYDCLFKNVHIGDSEVVSLDRFTDYEQPYASNYTSLAFADSTIRRLSKVFLQVYPNTTLLTLQDLQLRTIDRDAFVHGGQVQQLYLSFNSLSQLERGLFDSLHSLQIVALNRNRLSYLPVGLFAHNPMLFSVSMTHNSLTRIDDRTFTNNPQLESVNVSSNSIEHYDLSLLSAAYEIDVSYNRLTQVKLPARLGRLFASNNHIERIVPNGQNRELKELSLSNNKLSNIAWAALYPGLEELDLSHNEIEEVKNLHLPKLKKLLLNNNRLFSFALVKLPVQRPLRVLDLSYNQLTYVESSSAVFDGLHQLYLHNNEIVTLKLSSNNILQNVSLSYNDWDCANLRTQLEVIESSVILDNDAAPCKDGYIMENQLCCKEAKKAYLDRLLEQIRQKSVFELAKRLQCDDYQHTVVDIDKLNEALATATVQSPDTLRDEVNELQSTVTSLTAEKGSNEQLLTTVKQNLIFNMERYGADYEGFDTPRMMADKLITKLDARNSVRKNQTISQWQATNEKNAEREELKSVAGQLETILSNKKAVNTQLKQDSAKINQEIKKIQARLNANAASRHIYA
ncbi:leucine-rich repeats and immunoglobulin-like domains protein sma-10 [Anopheles aquasalis]|uniref:leucine-rich repeats and immunoglobulin-like domains protein sma-10 n=1 Tax=Anopheles aquasalis TaxID=42839 RepID=UPI00215B65EC|nr:leucine-rich repeats and immunoglobulin-like domains protein sma-10 [Anopheles aquasalis]